MTDRRLVSSTLSARIIEHLRRDGHNQVTIARMLGVSEPFISLVKIRERSLNLDHVERLADILGLPLGAFFLAVTESGDSRKVKNRNTTVAQIMKQADIASDAILRDNPKPRRKAG